MSAVNYDKGREYLKKNGTDVIKMAGRRKLVFQPGSAYTKVKKERLPEKFFLENLKKEVSFTQDFIKLYNMTTRVDLDRLLRACSILITGFDGPISDDYPKKHHERLFKHLMIREGILCESDIHGALVEFGRIIGIPDDQILEMRDYTTASKIIGGFYALWSYSDLYLSLGL
ncbi:MAG: hypothetical protein ACTSSH_04665 [Candidatus Heimdallarchaeota archaeon]